MTAALKAQGLILNHKTVLKLMKSENVLCKVRIKKYRSFLGEVGQIAPNLLQRDFTTAAPNQKWATDITEFRMFGERCYLSVLMDLHTQDVIHFTMANNPKLPLVTKMIDEALKREPEAGKGLIIHSDQGWHYQHRAYRDILSAREISQSMSRRGNCLDNAMMEGFFGILKSELLYLQEFNSKDHFKEELISYMDYYNNRRIKLKLNGLPPAVYRRQVQEALFNSFSV